MKFIDLEVLCEKTETSHPGYSDLLEELNIETDKEYYWKTICLNYDPLKDEVLMIESRKDNDDQSVISFYGSSSIVVNMPVEELKKKLYEITESK